MRHNRRLRNLLFLGAVILILLGIFFRFYNLDKKIYWFDESYTSLWISGYSQQEVEAEISYDQRVPFENLNRYHGLAEYRKGLPATIERLAEEDAQHPPFYYALTYLWTHQVGSSPIGFRSLSALIGVLVLPGIYWLGIEVFGNYTAALLSTIILAVSPFHILWSQEARQYNLWILLIILSSAIFLRSLKTHKKISWATYTLSVVLGLYTHAFMTTIVAVHTLYLISCKSLRKQRRKIIIPFVLSLLVAYMAFLPWALNIVRSGFGAAGWTSESLSLPTYWKIFTLNIVRTFFDLDFDSKNPLSYLGIAVLAVVVYAAIHIVRNIRKGHNLFILYICVLPLIPFLAADIFLGGQRALVSRYSVGYYLGLELMVIGYLSTKIKTKLSQSMIAIVLCLSISSSYHLTQSDLWWNKQFSNDNLPISRIINQYDRPLVLMGKEMRDADILSTSYSIKPEASLMRLSKAKSFSECNEDTFLLNSSQALAKELTDQGYIVKSVLQGQKYHLWEISCGSKESA